MLCQSTSVPNDLFPQHRLTIHAKTGLSSVFVASAELVHLRFPLLGLFLFLIPMSGIGQYECSTTGQSVDSEAFSRARPQLTCSRMGRWGRLTVTYRLRYPLRALAICSSERAYLDDKYTRRHCTVLIKPPLWTTLVALREHVSR